MARKGTRKEDIPERKHPGNPEPEPCSPGSIEQELDMCEEGSLKGDQVIRDPLRPVHDAGEGHRALDPDEMEHNYHVDMSEDDREGDEMSGDEHSSGFQGGEPELNEQPHMGSGMPGDRTRRSDQLASDEDEQSA